MMLEDISVVVLSYGPADTVRDTLELLLRDDSLAADQILEMHNPAYPGEVAHTHIGQRTINADSNLGYAGGMNVALRDSATRARKFILLLTHDVLISPEAVATLRGALLDDLELAAVGPVLQQAGQTWSAGRARTDYWHFPHLTDAGDGQDVVRTASLDGSAIMLRVADLGEDLFDDSFFMYYEETELLERLVRKGFGIAVAQNAVAESMMGVDRRPRAHAYLMARNGVEVALRFGGPIAALRHIAFIFRRRGIDIAKALAKMDRPRTRLSLLRLVAECRGIVDFCIRRFGPPPKSIADGDMHV